MTYWFLHSPQSALIWQKISILSNIDIYTEISNLISLFRLFLYGQKREVGTFKCIICLTFKLISN